MSDEEIEHDIDELARSARTGDEDDLREALNDAVILLRRLHDERTDGRLAKSVLDFAMWQDSGYCNSTETKNSISRRLWLEVAEHVHRITETTPPAPRFNG